NGGVAKFLEKRGEGLHHVCFETPDVAGELGTARAAGFPLIDEAPRPGLAGTICFLHPKGTRGILVEFVTPPPGEHHTGSVGAGPFAGLALRAVVARSREASTAAALFEKKLGLRRPAAPVSSSSPPAGPTPGGGPGPGAPLSKPTARGSRGSSSRSRTSTQRRP